MIIGMFHAKNEKDPAHRFWPTHAGRPDRQTAGRGESDNPPKNYFNNLIIFHSLKLQLLTGEILGKLY